MAVVAVGLLLSSRQALYRGVRQSTLARALDTQRVRLAAGQEAIQVSREGMLASVEVVARRLSRVTARRAVEPAL